MKVTSGKVAPEQTVPPPVTLETVGLGLTTTDTGVPRLVPTHVFASLNAVMEYVPAAALFIV